MSSVLQIDVISHFFVAEILLWILLLQFPLQISVNKSI